MQLIWDPQYYAVSKETLRFCLIHKCGNKKENATKTQSHTATTQNSNTFT